MGARSKQAIRFHATIGLFFICVTALAQGNADLKTLVSVNANSTPIEEVLRSLEKNYGIKFSYSSSSIDLSRKISLRLDKVPLDQALNTLFKESKIRYTKVGEQIVLSKGTARAKSQRKQLNSITGVVIDKETGLPVTGATIYLAGTYSGTLSDYNGQFEIGKIQDGKHKLVIGMMGYSRDTITVNIGGGKTNKINHSLSYQSIELDVAIVEGDKITGRTTVSDIALSEKEITVAQSLTEDPIQALGTLPGVSRSGRLLDPGNFSIRGGSNSENLYLLDNALVLFPWTLAGKSIFNPNIIEKSELLTGGFPVTYGHFMSSVLNVTTRTGDMEHYRANASISLLNMQATVEGPIIPGKLSVIASGRRSVLDLVIPELDGISFPQMKDLTYKVTYSLNSKNRISYSGYHLQSDLSANIIDSTGKETRLAGANEVHTSSIQWQSQWSKKLYSKLSVLNSFFDMYILRGAVQELNLELNDHYIREDITYFLNSNNKLKAGIETHYYNFDANGYEPLQPQFYFMNDTTLVLYDYIIRGGAGLAGAYVMYDGTVYKRLKTNAGIRIDKDLPDGNLDIGPRAALSYEFDNHFEIRLAYGLYHQTVGPVTYHYNPSIRSGRCDHYIIGVKKKFSSSWSGWMEAYYKDYKRYIVKELFNYYTDMGTGYARGIEAFIRKESGNLTGWLSYSLTDAERRDVPGGTPYLADLNQTHIFNIVLEYAVSNRPIRFVPAKITANFKAATGSPYTPLTNAAFVNNQWQPVFGPRNSARNPTYHNLNARISWNRKLGKAKRHQLVTYLEAWNLYGQKSITSRGYEYNLTLPGNVKENLSLVEPFVLTIGFKIYLNSSE